MDSLTQIVLGAACAEAVAGRKIGNRALLYGAILGTIPDLDVLIGMQYDIVTSNEIHRGISHSILFFAMVTPIFAMLLRWIERRNGLTFREAALMSFICLFTHAILDAFTNFGTQLFWPLEKRVSIQSIFVVDPLYTLPFLFCLIMVMRFRRTDPRRDKWNIRGLTISTSYLVLTFALQQAATYHFEKALGANGISYKQVTVRPAPLNAVLWNANIDAGNGYYLAEYSFFDTKPIAFQFFPQNLQLIQGHENDRDIRRLIKMAEGWYTLSTEGDKLYFNDLRFGLIGDNKKNPEFVFRYLMVEVDGQLEGRIAESPAKEDPKKLLRQLWKRMWGN